MQFSDLFYIDAAGYHTSDYPTVLAWLTAAYQNIYGSDVQLSSDTQDGQWLAIQAQGFYDAGMLGAAVYNSFSPVTAQGLGLARVVLINGITKRIATNSTVDITIGGTVGTLISNGIASDTLNQQWLLPASVTIPSGGTITVTATAQTAGAIAAAASTITNIFTPTNGWQTVTNAGAATLGVAVETDAELRSRQAISTANPSSTVFEGTLGAVANVPGVTASAGYENDTGSTDGNGIPAHSISIIAAGGDSVAVAQAIYDHKGPGCGTYGTTSEVVYDNHGVPLTINFYRPTIATITVQVTISTFAGYSSDYATDIQNEVAAVINAVGIGAINSGENILISRLFIPAYLPDLPAASETYDVVSIEIKKNAGSFVSTNLAILFNEQPFCDPLVDVVIVT